MSRWWWWWWWSSAGMFLLASAAPPADPALPIPLQTKTFFTDWGAGAAGAVRGQQPVCLDIPANMSLCQGVGYKQMRLPNLLEHDTVSEAGQQAASWVPLVNIRCHGDVQLFLCALFSPVCLERGLRAVYPCRSLCEAVRRGCEGRMRVYGYPWPEMFRCDKFPLDNDMCIAPQSESRATGATATHQYEDHHEEVVIEDANDECRPCKQEETYENVLDNLCRSDFAVRARLRNRRSRGPRGGHMEQPPGEPPGDLRTARVLKVSAPAVRKLVRDALPSLPPGCPDCQPQRSAESYLVMGSLGPANYLEISFVLPWTTKSKAIKKAVRTFTNTNCTNPNLVSRTVIVDTFTPVDGSAIDPAVFGGSSLDFAERPAPPPLAPPTTTTTTTTTTSPKPTTTTTPTPTTPPTTTSTTPTPTTTTLRPTTPSTTTFGTRTPRRQLGRQRISTVRGQLNQFRRPTTETPAATPRTMWVASPSTRVPMPSPRTRTTTAVPTTTTAMPSTTTTMSTTTSPSTTTAIATTTTTSPSTTTTISSATTKMPTTTTVKPSTTAAVPNTTTTSPSTTTTMPTTSTTLPSTTTTMPTTTTTSPGTTTTMPTTTTTSPGTTTTMPTTTTKTPSTTTTKPTATTTSPSTTTAVPSTTTTSPSTTTTVATTTTTSPSTTTTVATTTTTTPATTRRTTTTTPSTTTFRTTTAPVRTTSPTPAAAAAPTSTARSFASVLRRVPPTRTPFNSWVTSSTASWRFRTGRPGAEVLPSPPSGRRPGAAHGRGRHKQRRPKGRRRKTHQQREREREREMEEEQDEGEIPFPRSIVNFEAL